jgi:hypothetical protein
MDWVGYFKDRDEDCSEVPPVREPGAHMNEKHCRIVGCLLELWARGRSDFEASYEEIGRLAGAHPRDVRSLCWAMRDHADSGISGRRFLSAKSVDKGVHAADIRQVRRFVLRYPDRDAIWHLRMLDLSESVFQFAVKKGLLNRSNDEIKAAHRESGDCPFLYPQEPRPKPERPPTVKAASRPSESQDRDRTQTEIIERLDRIELLLRQLVKARAFQERTIPFDEDEDGEF